MTEARRDEARKWGADYLMRKVGISTGSFEAINEAPIYELVDSLDLVEMLGAFEQALGITVDASCLKWARQPSARQLIEDLARQVDVQ